MRNTRSYYQRKYEEEIEQAIQDSLKTQQPQKSEDIDNQKKKKPDIVKGKSAPKKKGTPQKKSKKDDLPAKKKDLPKKISNPPNKTIKAPLNEATQAFPNETSQIPSNETLQVLPKETSQVLPNEDSQTPPKKASINPLFVEFQIDQPTPSSIPPRFKSPLSKKYKGIGPINSTSSTTSSATSDDDSYTYERKNQKQNISLNLPIKSNFPPLIIPLPKNMQNQPAIIQEVPVIPELPEEQESPKEIEKNQKVMNDVYNDYDENAEYNDVDSDNDFNHEEDGEDGSSNKSKSNINLSIPHQSQNIDEVQSSDQRNEPNILSSSTGNTNFRDAILPKNLNMITPQINKAPSNQVSKAHPGGAQYSNNHKFNHGKTRINDPKIISALYFLDQYENNANNDQNQNDVIELTHDGKPFYSLKRETFENNKFFPTDPIKPSSNNNMETNAMAGMSPKGQLFNNDFDNDYDYNNDFEGRNENDFKISIDENNSYANQGVFNTYNFEIAPYLQQKQQAPTQDQTDEIQRNENVSKNDHQAHDSNENENKLESNDNINSLRSRIRSRFYQHNGDSGSDNDYDIEYDDHDNSSESDVINEGAGNADASRTFQQNHSIFTGMQKTEYQETDIRAFTTVPYRPMSIDEYYHLMMDSMIYDEKKFLKQ